MIAIENTNRFVEKDIMNRILDMSAEYAIKVWTSYEIPERLPQTVLQRILQDKLLPYSDSKALAVWSFRDEPKTEETDYLINAVALFRNMNNKQLVGFVHGGKGRAIIELEGVADFVAVDDYPIFNKNREPESISRTTVHALQKTKKPVWIVLQACSFRDFLVQPTPAELRLMTHKALANGAKGLFYFLFNYKPYWIKQDFEYSLADVWLNTGPLWREVGIMGKRLTAIGPLLLASSPVSSTKQGITVQGSDRLQWNVIRDSQSDIDYFIIYNNDTTSSVQAEISVAETVSGKRRFYDLYELIDTNGVRSLPYPFSVQLMPGDGKIMALCTHARFQAITRNLGRTRFDSELAILKREMRQMILWNVDVTAIQKTVKTAERTSESDIFAAVGMLESAQHTLREAFNQDLFLKDAHEKLEQARALFAKIDALLNNAVKSGRREYVENYRGRVLSLGKTFFALKYGFQKGQRKIGDQVEACLKSIKELYAEMVLPSRSS